MRAFSALRLSTDRQFWGGVIALRGLLPDWDIGVNLARIVRRAASWDHRGNRSDAVERPSDGGYLR